MEEQLKNILKTIRLNEGVISMFLGLAVVLVVAGMIVNYFQESPTRLPTVEDQPLDATASAPITLDADIDLGATSTPSGQLAQAAVSPTATVAVATPTARPTVTATPTAVSTPTAKPTVTVAPTLTKTPSPVATITPTTTPKVSPSVQPTATKAPVATSTVAAPTATKAPVTPSPVATGTVAPTPTAGGQIASGVTTTAPKDATYTVQKGENLWRIAEAQYQTGYAWVEIAKANKIDTKKAGHIEIGQKLTMPQLSRQYPQTVSKPATVSAQPTVANPITGTEYTVQKGDNLWTIAVRAYNDGYKWTQIAKANNIDIQKAGRIEIGMKLTIPRQ